MGKCDAARRLGCGLVAVVIGGSAQAACGPGLLDLRWGGGAAHFAVEIADTAAERELGLMHRDQMASAAGMIFVYDRPVHAQFWMKDTLIPLDMIFADAAGVVTAVHSNAIPGDLTPIDGGEGVVYVVEINGGLAAGLGIAPGAVMRSDLIDPALAEWTCAAP